MSALEALEKKSFLKALSVLVALLLFLFTAGDLESETVLTVPVRYENVPATLKVISPLPGQVRVTVAGPRLSLLKLGLRHMEAMADLGGLRPGTSSVTPDIPVKQIDPELRIKQVVPASITVEAAPGRAGQ